MKRNCLSLDKTETMPQSRLEDLLDEILRQVLSDFSPKEIVRSWYNVNTRIDRLVWSLDYHVRLIRGNVTEADLRANLLLRDRVPSLSLTKRWCEFILYFRSIRALRIVGKAYSIQFSRIDPFVLPSLEHVSHWDDFSWNTFMGAANDRYAKQILSFDSRKPVDIPARRLPPYFVMRPILSISTSVSMRRPALT